MKSPIDMARECGAFVNHDSAEPGAEFTAEQLAAFVGENAGKEFPQYTINGRPATKDRAQAHWLASASYESANRATREHIWRDAHREDGGRWGEINWLNEAGVHIILAQDRATPSTTGETAP